MGALSADVSLNLLARSQLAQTILKQSHRIAVWAGERHEETSNESLPRIGGIVGKAFRALAIG
jgi:hypothetical protein